MKVARRPLRTIAADTRQAWPIIRRGSITHGASYAMLAARFLNLYSTRQFSTREIVALDLMDPRIGVDELDRMMSKRALLQLQSDLNPRSHWPLTEDKRVFYRYCAGANLATPRLFGCVLVASPGGSPALAERLRARATALFAAIDRADLVIKPTAGVYGHGVITLTASGGTFSDGRGSTYAAGEIYDLIAANDRYRSFVVQERLCGHPRLAALSGTSSLQTIRMVSYLTRDGQVTIGGCLLKVIGGDLPTDNYGDGRRGNLIAEIPRASGVVRTAFKVADDGYGTIEVARHPRTGAVFKGFALPFWPEACALVERAAREFVPLRTIGWDVAITASGPLLIEGNVCWDPTNEGTSGDEPVRAIRADRS